MSEDTLITAAGEENDGTDGDGDGEGEEKYPGGKEKEEGGEGETTIPRDDDSGEWN